MTQAFSDSACKSRRTKSRAFSCSFSLFNEPFRREPRFCFHINRGSRPNGSNSIAQSELGYANPTSSVSRNSRSAIAFSFRLFLSRTLQPVSIVSILAFEPGWQPKSVAQTCTQ